MLYSKSTAGFYTEDIHGAAIPADAVEISESEHRALMDGQASGLQISSNGDGLPVLAERPAPTPGELQAMFVAAIQRRLDAFAQTRGYDGILSACTYATSAVPRFASEGQACVDMRDATWSAAYAILADVQAGGPMPTMDAVMAQLPALEWPQ